ncbi:protein EVI2B [Monodelphis domestica]|uniref:protein EVI2B n=1 Tax=Monodelphis domestica TaxID=13616 RepID=UPI0024E23550|nr:protein EVI2B [Monodelphis domestica]XP_007485636.2 protein EVI2B [Monodelphis domestica]XP_056675470.1 protein EVI2B [Monodelphis domestica]
MDLKHFIIMLLCGYLKIPILTKSQAYSTVSPQTSPFKSSVLDTTANFEKGTEKPLNQQPINTPSAQPPPSLTSSPSEQPSASPVPRSSGELLLSTVPDTSRQPSLIPTTSGQTPVPPVLKSSIQPMASPVHNPTSQPPGPPVPSFSGQPAASPIPNSFSQSPRPHVHYSPSQSPETPIPNSTRQPSVAPVPSFSKKPPESSVPSSSKQSASTVVTPGFIEEENNDIIQKKPSSSSASSIAGVLIGTILTFMIVAIIMIVLWKCFRKPILHDQNWAGRSPFADGETPDLCMDYSRENGKSIKRSSIVSLEIWKPNKSMLLADDLDVKLFESSENLDECPKSETEKMKDPPNGVSEDSTDRSTIGTAISSSEETELTPAPALLALEEPGNQTPDSSNMPLSDFSHLPPPVDCLDSEVRQSLPPPSDSSTLPPPPEDLLSSQEEYSTKTPNSVSSTLETEFPIPPDSSQQALDELLPPPPAELL